MAKQVQISTEGQAAIETRNAIQDAQNRAIQAAANAATANASSSVPALRGVVADQAAEIEELWRIIDVLYRRLP